MEGVCFLLYAMEETYTVDEAARILKLTPGRIRQMLRAGELEGISPEASGERGWRIPMHAVHDRDRPARVERASLERPLGGSVSPAEASQIVRDLERQLGRLEGRLELTEQASSTIKEERDRLLAERDRERLRAEKLQAELDRARQPWWRKIFGSER
jgi:excisionase family DNA binding protein